MDAAPELWKLTQQWRYRNSGSLRKFVTPDHQIVLEGFPRCGNSFAVRAFLHANGTRQNWSIATHAHRIAQVELAVKYGLPTVIFIREPREAISSLAALNERPADDLATRNFIIEKMEYYARYHQRIWELHDRLIISRFETTVSRFGSVIEALNAKFDRTFVPYSDLAADTQSIFATSRTHLSPDPKRDALKPAMKNIYDRPDLENARTAAENAYARLADVAL